MLDMEERNQTNIREFILLGLGNLPQLQLFFFWFFLVIYLMTIIGNLLIFLLIVTDQHLHTPMYFFLAKLSCLDTCYSSIFLPKMLANMLREKKTISVKECLGQYHLLCICAALETYILAAMSYDRYSAICRPLLYASIMTKKLFFQLMAGTWINSLIFNIVLISVVSQLSFCGPNVIDHYFCDLRPLMKLSCSNTSLLKLFGFLMAIVFTIVPFLLTLISYVCIICAIIKIQTSTGREKAFSTCSSHLIVVCLYYGTLIISYVLPDTPSLRPLSKIFSITYTVMTPLINPFIYTLRNKEIHKALRRLHDKIVYSICLKQFETVKVFSIY